MNAKIKDVSDSSFEAEALNSAVSVLVDCWAHWRNPCRLIAPIVEEFAESNLFQAKIVRLDVDQNRAVREKYRIRSIPTLMVFKDGQLVGAWIGALSGHKLASFVFESLRAA
jgi:thioredoxin 1